MQLLVFLLACYGVTNIITISRLFRGVRAWIGRRSETAGHWIECPMCIGVPVGAAWSLVGLTPPADLGYAGNAIVGAAVSSGWCWMVRVVMHRLGEDDL
jgi:hypothetical protein